MKEKTHKNQETAISAVLLAGGRARRMGGGDKGLLPVAGKCLGEWTLARLMPQADEILISANRNIADYARWGHCVVSDSEPDFAGPLAGICAAMVRAEGEWILSAPCDSPLLPVDLAARLLAGARAADAEIAVARAGGRTQPVFLLARRDLRADLEDFLRGGDRKIDLWYPRHRFVEVDFPDAEAFLNANTAEELESLAPRLGRQNREA